MPQNPKDEQRRRVKQVRELIETGKATQVMVRNWLAEIEAGREPVWPTGRPSAGSPGQARRRLEGHLRRVIADAEAELSQLGYSPTAWQRVNAYLSDTMPAFGGDFLLEQLLGPQAPSGGRGVLPTRALRSLDEIKRQAKQCPRCRAAIKDTPSVLVGHALVVQAKDHHPELFRRYRAELAKWEKDFPAVIREMPAWAAAYRAATAHAALENPDSPMAAFAAGAYLEHQRLIEVLGRILPAAERKRVLRQLAPDVQRGRKVKAAARAGGEARAEPYRSRQPEIEQVARDYWAKKRGRATVRWHDDLSVAVSARKRRCGR